LFDSESDDDVAAVTAGGAISAVVAKTKLPALAWRSVSRVDLSRDREDFSLSIGHHRLGSGAGLEVDHLEDRFRHELVAPLVHHGLLDDATGDLPCRPHLFRPHAPRTSMGNSLQPIPSRSILLYRRSATAARRLWSCFTATAPHARRPPASRG